jgi:hypothetical protein
MFAKKIRVTFRAFALNLRFQGSFRGLFLAVRMFATRIGFFSQPERSSRLFLSLRFCKIAEPTNDVLISIPERSFIVN